MHVQHKIHKRSHQKHGPSDAQKREGYKQLRIATQVGVVCDLNLLHVS